MPRLPRIKTINAIYHIIQRGNERKDIFLDEEDKSRFLDTLAKYRNKYEFKTYAYCLMDNHVHLIIGCENNDISQVMKSINVSYVIYFNRKYQRVGHLFQDRFKSELVQDDKYLLELSRYIHRNPVKANIVNTPGEYKWSSYNIYTGKVKDYRNLVDISLVLDCISSNRSYAIKEYEKYVNRMEGRVNSGNGTSTKIMDIPEEMKLENPGKETIMRMIEEVANTFGVTPVDIYNKGAPFVEARNAAIYKLRQNTGLRLGDIGNIFGLSHSAVSKIIKTFANSKTEPSPM